MSLTLGEHMLHRDGEQTLVGKLLEAVRDSRSGAFLIRGVRGVGKSALLVDARARDGQVGAR